MSENFNMADLLFKEIRDLEFTTVQVESLENLIEAQIRQIFTVLENSGNIGKTELHQLLERDNNYKRYRSETIRNLKHVRYQLETLLDIRTQRDKATSIDHTKMWIYKTITGITIALIVLGTAFTANQLGILIPTIRFGI